MLQDFSNRFAINPPKACRPNMAFPFDMAYSTDTMYKSTDYISPPFALQHQVSDCGILLRDGQITKPFPWVFCLRDSHFGLCDLGLGCPEIGSLSIAEVTGLRGALGLPVERDLHITLNQPLSVYADRARGAGHIVTAL